MGDMDKRWSQEFKDLARVLKDLPTAGEIRRASNQGAVMQLEVIEQDGEKYVVLPDEVLEQCGVGGISIFQLKMAVLC